MTMCMCAKFKCVGELARALTPLDAWVLGHHPTRHCPGWVPVFAVAFIHLLGWNDRYLTWALAGAHFNLMMKKFVKAQANSTTQQEKKLMRHQVRMYDVMIRQHWQVSLKKDACNCDWAKEAASINKEVWAYAV